MFENGSKLLNDNNKKNGTQRSLKFAQNLQGKSWKPRSLFS